MQIKFTSYLVFVLIFLASCGTVGKKSKVDNSVTGRAKTVLQEAHSYMGTPYKYGGVTKRGMDCSGLVLQSYKKVNIDLPRITRDQAKHGMKVKLRNVQPGDLLFFNTSGSKISHVGIVDHIKNGEIFFIHASTSKGVMVSSLENTYWKPRFVKAIRYLH
ncbi:C40 family peptidase [Weeksellaceae bacterium KMM 9724]|uniref:C40 family peptidase n=1 Tax=Profundicola chukchiensis TaxID=2961959 RepID=UPI00243E6732|nr:C40 family peptidase [Profundicola chukchiensis]MDG4951525.1 C40 family peptidase [Profundicola chukchiensis]